MARNSLYHIIQSLCSISGWRGFKAIFDKDSKVAAVMVVATGLYIGIATIIISKHYDEKGNKNV